MADLRLVDSSARVGKALQAARAVDAGLEALYATVAARIAELEKPGASTRAPPSEAADAVSADVLRDVCHKLRSVAAKLRRAHVSLRELVNSEGRIVARARARARHRAKRDSIRGGHDVGA